MFLVWTSSRYLLGSFLPSPQSGVQVSVLRWWRQYASDHQRPSSLKSPSWKSLAGQRFPMLSATIPAALFAVPQPQRQPSPYLSRSCFGSGGLCSRITPEHFIGPLWPETLWCRNLAAIPCTSCDHANMRNAKRQFISWGLLTKVKELVLPNLQFKVYEIQK